MLGLFRSMPCDMVFLEVIRNCSTHGGSILTMTDLYDRIVGDRNALEGLLSKIPGFKGYMEMSSRREADRMIRDHVAGRFKPLIDRLASLETEMLSSGGFSYMERTKSIKTKLQNIHTRIAVDSPGYSGFFASNKIGPDELEKIYAFDAAMERYADEIAVALDTLQTAVRAGGEGIPDALAGLDAKIAEAHQAYDLREQVLNGISE